MSINVSELSREPRERLKQISQLRELANAELRRDELKKLQEQAELEVHKVELNELAEFLEAERRRQFDETQKFYADARATLEKLEAALVEAKEAEAKIERERLRRVRPKQLAFLAAVQADPTQYRRQDGTRDMAAIEHQLDRIEREVDDQPEYHFHQARPVTVSGI